MSTEDELHSISKSVSEAEKNTSGEIIPMVVLSSSTAHQTVMFAFLMIQLILVNLSEVLEIDDTYFSLQFGITVILFLIFKRQLVKKLSFAKKYDQMIWDRAELEFYRGRMHETAKRTGILIFISMLERRVIVLADKSISDKHDQKTWDDLVHTIAQHMSKKKLALGLSEAIAQCGKILSKDFPAESNNPNEYADRLIIKK